MMTYTTKQLIRTLLCVFILYTTEAQVFTKVTTDPIGNYANDNYFGSWGDYDKDGDLDFYTGTIGPNGINTNGLNLMYRNNCNSTFSQVTNIPGGLVTESGLGSFNYWIDYDNDSDLDLHLGGKEVFRNNGNGSFEKVTITTATVYEDFFGMGPATFADYDNDGYLDFYSGKKAIYRNNGNGDYVRIDAPEFANTKISAVGIVTWADYDNDGFMDMYVINIGSFTPTMAFDGFGRNILYHNNGNGTFTEITTNPSMNESFWSYGGAWADMDNDLDLDLLVEDINTSVSKRRIYINNGNGSFTRLTTGDLATIGVGLNQAGSTFADYDNDGDLDLYAVSFNQAKLFDNDGYGNFTYNGTEPLSTDGVFSYGGAWADYDNDGDLDMVVVTGDVKDILYRNDITGRNWMKFHLNGVVSNRDAIGARVYVKATINGVSKWQMREINANTLKGGEAGATSGHVVHIGLGDATVIDSLKIVWPASNTTQVFTNVTPNQFLEITENINTLAQATDCKPALPQQNLGFVTGKTYNDVNQNCVFDAGDNIIGNKIVQATPGNYYAFSDNNGDYKLELPAGTYKVSQYIQDDIWNEEVCTGTNEHVVNIVPATTISGKDFANEALRIACNGSYNLTISALGVDQGTCPTGNTISPCPGLRFQYCFTLVNISNTPLALGSILNIQFPAGFQTIAGTGTISPSGIAFTTSAFGTNVLNVTLNSPVGLGTPVVFCITVLNTNSVATNPYTTTAHFNNATIIPNNLVFNGNFDLGAGGFNSQYTFDCFPNSGQPFEYCVGADPSIINGNWLQTARSLPNFLYADGSAANEVIWERNIAVSPNTIYTFSAWFNNVVKPTFTLGSWPNLEISINNTPPFFATGGIPANPDQWRNVTFNWCSGTNNSALIRIRDLETNSAGNDFGIDDISFREGIGATLVQNTNCACDPNDKVVTPEGCGVNGNVAKNQELTYRVRFQNLGTGPAHDVLISDLLDSDLDIGTLQIQASSHTITGMQIMPDNNLIIKFDGIELPSNLLGESESIGYVIFSISPKIGLADGTVISNQAAIYFDQNEVVMTAVTTNTLYDRPTPDASFTYKHNCTNTGLAYDFTYTGSTPDNATYLWEFEDGIPAMSTAQNPVNILFSNANGYKLVKLTVSRNGCTEIVMDTIKVESVLTHNSNKITICHNGQTLSINLNSLQSHMAHGDCIGACPSATSARKRNIEANNSMEDVDMNSPLVARIFPNPTNKQFTIVIGEVGETEIKVIDAFGKQVIQHTTNDSEIEIDMEHVSKGLYFVIVSKDGKIYKEKIIKN